MTHQQVWFVWALNLLAQNFMSTIASRSRKSGSFSRHVVAAIGYSALWMLQFQILVGPMMEYLNGKHGLPAQIGTAAFYTAFTVAGSVITHYWASATVVEGKKYPQITQEEWSVMQDVIKHCGNCHLTTEVEELKQKLQIVEDFAHKVAELETTAQKLVSDWSRVDYESVLKLTPREWAAWEKVKAKILPKESNGNDHS